ncbi:hypothetical protein WI604_25735 [Bradyrhizobium symbiodeficiens]|uniref:hypothetical protein n=1 Tax=Bradyrhizobium symbiodeficiens TaxID=1404367 RepID=UPI0030D175DE
MPAFSVIFADEIARRFKMTVRFAVKLLVGAALVFSAQAASAQVGTPNVTPAQISAFQANPGQLLGQFPDGGQGLISQITDLASADKNTVAAIIALARNANEDQRKAIAQGLATAAKAYATGNDPGSANQISQEVVASGLPEFQKAYAEAAGDTGTAAAGGGGGGGGGPTASGPPSGGQNGGNGPNGNTFAANGFSLTGGTGIGGITPVSPF